MAMKDRAPHAPGAIARTAKAERDKVNREGRRGVRDGQRKLDDRRQQKAARQHGPELHRR
jgi:hypothetical protein